MNKKILSLLIAVLLVCSLFSGFGALAGSSNGAGTGINVTTTFSKTTGLVRGEADILLTIGLYNYVNVATAINAFAFKVTYDPAVFTIATSSGIVEATGSGIDALNEETGAKADQYTPNKDTLGLITISYIDTFGSSTTGLLEGDKVKIKFNVNANAPYGNSTITISNSLAGTPGYPTDFSVSPNNKVTPAFLPSSQVMQVPDPAAAIPVDATLTYAGGAFTVTPTGGAVGYTYQVWTEETTVDGTSWVLVQPFSSLAGNATWVKGDALLADNYKICVRVKDATGTLVQTINKQFSAKAIGIFKVDSLTVDGVISPEVITKNANTSVAFVASAIKATGNDSDIVYNFYINGVSQQQSTSNTFAWAIGDAVPGLNIIKVIAWQTGSMTMDDVSVQVIVVNPTKSVPIISSYIVPPTGTVGIANAISMSTTIAGTYKLSIGEPGKAAFLSTSNASLETAIAFPGVYQVTGSVKDSASLSASDGFVKRITVARASGTPANISGVTVNSVPAAVETNVAAKGAIITIAATANIESEYSFYKVDARGTRLVQDWSTDNDWVWTPMQAGNYSIQVRVRDIAFAGPTSTASYEDAQTLAFAISGADQAVSNVVITAPGTAVKRTAVAISATATAVNSLNLMYRFEVSDIDMGGQLIQDYTMSNATTFIPRKAGTYTIRVLAKDANNFGYYDAIATQIIVVS